MKRKPLNKNLKLAFQISLPILVGLILFWLVFKNINLQDFIDIVKNANAWYLILYFALSVLLMLCSVFRWKLILLSQNHKIKFIYLVKSYLAGYGVSYITPSAKLGGEPVRAALLKRYGLKTHESLSTIIIDKSLELSGSALFFVIGAVILVLNYALPDNLKFLIVIVSIIFLGLIGFGIYQIVNEKGFILSTYKFFRLHKLKKFKNLTKKLIDIEKLIIKFYKKDKKHFFSALFIMAIAWGLMFAEFKVAMLIFGFDANLLQIFLTFSVVGAAYLIPVPFAMGTLEGGQVALFNTIGLDSAIGFGVGLLTRARDSIIAAIGLTIATYYGVAKKKNITKSYQFNEEVFKYKKRKRVIKNEKNK
jgi:uncharacterized protein (TIRG00374 family)